MESDQTSELDESTYTLLQNTRVTFGPGIQVLDVQTGFESSYVILGNLPAVVTEDLVRDIASPFGEVIKVTRIHDEHRPSAKTTSAKIQFANSFSFRYPSI